MSTAPTIPLLPAPPLGGWTRSQLIELADRRTERRGSKTLDLNSEFLLALQHLCMQRRWSWRRKIAMFQIFGGQWQYDLTLKPPPSVGIFYAASNFFDGSTPSPIYAKYYLTNPDVLISGGILIGQQVMVQGVQSYAGTPGMFFNGIYTVTDIEIGGGTFPPGPGGDTGDLTANPMVLTIPQGGTGTSTITFTPGADTTGSVSLAASGTSGLGVVFSPNPATSTSLLTISAASNMPVGPAELTVYGSDGAARFEIVIDLTIISAGGGGGTPVDPAAEVAHNVSANSAYDKTNFSPNFTGTSYISATTTTPVNTAQMDDSMNPVTPAHVSAISVKTLISTVKWLAHMTPWFGQSNHINIGISCNDPVWAANAVADCTARGFDGCVIDWYGQGDMTDQAAQLIRQHAPFEYCIMIDNIYSSTAQLETHLAYISSQYFNDGNYLRYNGMPVVMFFQTTSGVDYATAKASVGVQMFWVFQGAGAAGQSYVDGTFGWPHPLTTGVNPSDPYNLGADNSYLSQGGGAGLKPIMPSLAPGFNGTLTKSAAWSLGKYLPRDHGKCWLSKVANLLANLPVNAPWVQVATWSDWEEGTQIESPIQNDILVTAYLNGSLLTWSVSGGTGDESTLRGYRVIANGPTGGFLIYTEGTGGSKNLDLSTLGLQVGASYSIFVTAVGAPCIRNQFSNTVTYVAAARSNTQLTVPRKKSLVASVSSSGTPGGIVTLMMGMTPGANQGLFTYNGINGTMVNVAALSSPDASDLHQFTKHGVRYYPNPGNPRQWSELTPMFERDLQMAVIYENTYYPAPKPPLQYFMMPGAFLVLCIAPVPDRNYPITIDYWAFPNMAWDSVSEQIPIIPAFMHNVLLKRLESQILRYTLGEGAAKYQAAEGEYNQLIATYAGIDNMVPGEHIDYSADDDYETTFANAQWAVQSTR